MAIATGTFNVTSMGEETVEKLEGGGKLTRAGGTQTFAGDIEGDGSVEWLMCYLPSGSARFLGLQRITGTIVERTGSIVIEAVGDHDGKESKGTWKVIPRWGTGELSGITGRGTFEAPGGPGGSYSLEYWLA
ncbi:MAG: DUF3224 domain-containing protein [Actinomycetota bacterium]